MTLQLGGVAGCGKPPVQDAPGQCLKAPPPEGLEVARVGSEVLTVAQLAARMQHEGAAAVRRYRTPANMRAYVEDQVRLELLVAAAFERGLDKDPDVIDAARKVMVRKLLLRDMQDPTDTGIPNLPSKRRPVKPERIRRYYEEHREDYMQPEKRRIADIQLAPTEQGRALAESIIVQLTKGAAEGKDARKHSDYPRRFRAQALKHTRNMEARKRGGEIPFATEPELLAKYGPSFVSRVFALESGTLAPEPVQSTVGWHVVSVVAVRDALVRGPDEVTEEIRARLERSDRSKKFDIYLAQLKTRHPVAIYDGRIAELIDAVTPESAGDKRGSKKPPRRKKP